MNSSNLAEDLVPAFDQHSDVIHARELTRSMNQYLTERGVDWACRVEVTKRGKWYELAGQVDSQWTRAVLFSKLPARGGRRYIVDKLYVISTN